MKTKYSIIAGILVSVFSMHAQILTPVKWNYTAKRLNKTEAVILITATIDKGWHIYSQDVSDGGPSKTELSFTKSADYRLVGKTIEPKPLKKFEKAFDMNVTYFENTVSFQQKINLTKENTVITGNINFMACSNSQCLSPEDVAFSVVLK